MEIVEDTSKRYKRNNKYQRWSENPGLVVDGEKAKFKISRIRDKK